MGKIQIFIVDDHTDFRKALRQHLAREEKFEIANEFADGEQLVMALCEKKCDLVLLDISMPLMYGLEALKRIRTLCPGVKTIIVSGRRENEYIEIARRYGAAGYVLKDDVYRDLIPVIEKVLSGETCFPQCCAG